MKLEKYTSKTFNIDIEDFENDLVNQAALRFQKEIDNTVINKIMGWIPIGKINNRTFYQGEERDYYQEQYNCGIITKKELFIKML